MKLLFTNPRSLIYQLSGYNFSDSHSILLNDKRPCLCSISPHPIIPLSSVIVHSFWTFLRRRGPKQTLKVVTKWKFTLSIFLMHVMDLTVNNLSEYVSFLQFLDLVMFNEIAIIGYSSEKGRLIALDRKIYKLSGICFKLRKNTKRSFEFEYRWHFVNVFKCDLSVQMQFYLTAVGCKIHLWLLHLFGSRKRFCWQWHTRERQNGESERKTGWRGETEDRKETERYVLIANTESVIILYRTITHVPFPTRGRERSVG